MADTRNALDKHLGVKGQSNSVIRFARYRALTEHVGEALNRKDYAAAQAYALLMIAERDELERVDVHLIDWEDLAVGISVQLAPELRRIADAIERLDR